MLERSVACFAAVALALVGLFPGVRMADAETAKPRAESRTAAPKIEPSDTRSEDSRFGFVVVLEDRDAETCKPSDKEAEAGSTRGDQEGGKDRPDRNEDDRPASSKLTVGSFDRVERPHRVPTLRAPCLRIPHKLAGAVPHDIPFIACWPTDRMLAARVCAAPLLLLRGAVETHAPPHFGFGPFEWQAA